MMLAVALAALATVGHAQAQADIPENCIVWNDGCNTCHVTNGRLSRCTKQNCFRQGDPYCVAKRPIIKPPSEPPTGGMVRCWVQKKTGRVYKGAGFPGRDWTLYQNANICPPPESKADGEFNNGQNNDGEQDGGGGGGAKGPCAKALAGMEMVPGRFIPKCDNNGNYFPVQCHGSVGTCWCADAKGKEMKGSRMSVRNGGVLTPERCAKAKNDQSKQKHGLRLGPRGTCGDGSLRRCMIMMRCPGHQMAATFNGCISCVNPTTCLADGH